MASLFQTTPQNVTIHIRNIYKEGELEINPTCKDYLQVQYEGTRTVKRMQKIYNPEKFPAGYVIELTSEDVVCLRSNFSTLNRLGRGKHSKYLPKAFTEKGLYMLATGSMSHNGCAKVWRAVTVFWLKQSQLWLKSGN